MKQASKNPPRLGYRRKEVAGTICSEVVLAIASILIWIPIYYFLIGAFKGRSDIVKFPLELTPSMATLGNFAQAFKKMNFVKAFLNTAAITVGALALVVVCSSLAGFAIARVRRRFFAVYYSLLIALMVVPFIGALIPLVVMAARMKLYETVIGCILIQAAWNLPFATFLYTGFMRALPKELEEAAYIDGCSMFRVYGSIFLPLLAPVTATCCIRCGISIWNDFLVSSSLLNSAYTPTLMVTVRSFFGAYVTEYGYAFAGIILASLPIIVMFLFLQKYFIKGLAAGAVKG